MARFLSWMRSWFARIDWRKVVRRLRLSVTLVDLAKRLGSPGRDALDWLANLC